MIIAEAHKVAQGLHGAEKADLQRLADEVEILTNQLSDLCHRGLVCTHMCKNEKHTFLCINYLVQHVIDL